MWSCDTLHRTLLSILISQWRLLSKTIMSNLMLSKTAPSKTMLSKTTLSSTTLGKTLLGSKLTRTRGPKSKPLRFNLVRTLGKKNTTMKNYKTWPC